MADDRVEIEDDSPTPSRDGGEGGRVLIVADEAVAGEELRQSVIDHLEGEPTSVFVVAPALVKSGFKHTMGDVDGAIGPAQERLERTLEELRRAGIDADGEVGDSDPMVAISDEILKFHPDQILLVAHGGKESAFAERGLLEQAQRDLDLPVTELIVDRGESPHVLDVKETERGAGRDKGWRPSANMPPLSKRDIGGILVAIVGTLLLGGLAADCVGAQSGHDFEEGRLNFACAARILIATGMALINLAHVVGLFLFQSVGYEGMWNRFFARLSLIGTPLAIVASLLLGLA
ncbi:MAG TPA: hypothetical protein VHF50_06255 [Solirubrobacterales bacterium]|nr:hypothetical protein [Solirubrobacterales bacterium]